MYVLHGSAAASAIGMVAVAPAGPYSRNQTSTAMTSSTTTMVMIFTGVREKNWPMLYLASRKLLADTSATASRGTVT